MAKRKTLNGRRACLRKAPKDHTHIGLCVMYCGTAFRGLQLQTHAPTHHTVEGVLIQALKDVGVVEGLQRGRVSGEAHHFSRSCRTDRGVHAVRNLICLFVPSDRLEAAGGCGRLPQLLNVLLPPTVRVTRSTPVMGDFIPRFHCTRRVYRYMIPAYALLSPCTSWGEFHAKFPNAGEVLQRRAGGSSFVDLCAGSEDLLLAALTGVVYRGNELLAHHMVGTHRFHNFSLSPGERYGHVWNSKVIHPNDSAAVRTIIRCEIAPRLFLFEQGVTGPTRAEYESSLSKASETSADARDDSVLPLTESSLPDTMCLPYLLFQIEGKSFLFNMIRKIVGLILAVLRGARESLMEELLCPERQAFCPLAPGSYLYLFHSLYSSYDARTRRSGSTRFCPLEEDWSGEVGEAASAFAMMKIAADIVDLDMNRVPSLGTLLSKSDARRCTTRPFWVEEDSHLVTMKEFRQTVEEPHPACSEMTLFLRSLRVHNWGLAPASGLGHGTRGRVLPSGGGERAKHRRTTESGYGDEKQVVKRSCGEGGTCEVVRDVLDNLEPITGEACAADDGWLYVAATPEEEKRLRCEYQKRVHPSSTEGCVSCSGVEVSPVDDDGGGSE